MLLTTPLRGGFVNLTESRGSYVATGSAAWGPAGWRSARNDVVGANSGFDGAERNDHQGREPTGAGSPGAIRRRAIAKSNTPRIDVNDHTWIALRDVTSNAGPASDPAGACGGRSGPPAGSGPPGAAPPGPGPPEPGAAPVAIAPTPDEAPGSDDGLDGAAGAVDLVGVGFGFDGAAGFAVGRAVGFGAGLGAGAGVGFGFGFVMTTRLGETAVSVTERAPAPLPLDALKR